MSHAMQSRAAPLAALFSFMGGVLMAFVLSYASTAFARTVTSELVIERAAGGALRFNVEVAQTAQEKATGLMFRTALADNEGMLFPYAQPDELTMWMRNTYIPLDMIFIRADGVIHRIEARTQPFSENVIASGGAVIAVLEVAGGACERLGIRAGDRVRHPALNASGR